MSTLKKEEQITVTNRDGTGYQIKELLGRNDHFNFYKVISDKYPDKSFILKISTKKEYNLLLEREAFLLIEMSETADSLDVFYEQEHPGSKLNYQLGFPKLIDNFVSDDQDNRRILILFLGINPNLSEVVPISLIRTIDKVRVDPKTSVWILGKLLKIISFAHDSYLKVGNLDGENIFIEKNNHLVTIFDWSNAMMKPEILPKSLVLDEVRCAVKAIVTLLGGDPETGIIPDHEQLSGSGVKYQELLVYLLTEDFKSTYDVHHYFYETVEEIWGRKYHPYTTIPM